MNRHGERFLTVSDFIDHCRSLNVRTDERELEHYEKIGVMLPVARKVYPEDYYIYQRQHEYVLDPLVPSSEIGKVEYPKLHRLTERVLHHPFPHGYTDLTDDELIHCFDREKGNNPYLICPGDSEFKPWDDYKVTVSELRGHEIKESVAEHYYSYWQVHQLYFIQCWPDLYQNAYLLTLIPEDTMPFGYPRAPSNGRLVGFDGMGEHFDALSFWITVYGRERGRTFASADVVGRTRRISESDSAKHQQRMEEQSRMVADSFGLTREGMYEFLRRLIDRYEKYERQERYKMAGDLKMDIFHLERLIEVNTGDALAAVLDNVSYYDAQTLRRLDSATRERDLAFRVLVRGAQRCASEIAEIGEDGWSFTESEVNEFLDYCGEEGLGIIHTALSGMVALGEEEERQKFRYVELYSNLKNILTSYEYLLKNLGERGQADVTGNLGGIIPRVMCGEGWCQSFTDRRNLAWASTTTEFLDNLDAILNDEALHNSLDGYWSRAFLITLIARNCAVHSCPTEDRYYVESFGHMLNAPITAMLFTWKFAKRRNWIR
ncbi:MAG: hypothetical protein OXI16_13420 [Chloroflexota bacterium]|nr:hypothetical protein [Chloroflexota bacterium]